MRRNVLSGCAVFTSIVILALLCAATPEGFAQEIPSPEVHPSDSAMPSAGEAPVTADDATVTAEVNEEGGRIVVEAKGVRPRVPTWFSAEVSGIASVEPGKMDYEFTLRLKVLQGRARVLSLGLGGDGELHDVSGDGLKAWAVRRVGPERFLDPETDRHPFSFYPFSGGGRSCIGMRFAMMEMQIVVAMIARHCERLERVNPEVVGWNPLLTLRPKDEVPLQVREGCSSP